MTAPSITVMYSPAPRVVHEKTLPLTEDMTVLQAIEASGFPHHDLGLSVWGRKATPEQALRDLDRVEICRPLTVDPKVARRERFQKQGSRGAGLFSKRRPGAKPGY